MIIPGLGAIKNYALIGLGLALAVLYGLLQASRLGRAKDREKVQKKSTEIREKAHKALNQGLQDEHEAMNRPADKIEDEF